jgi:rSAM/selenodomain-associated transferase 1
LRAEPAPRDLVAMPDRRDCIVAIMMKAPRVGHVKTRLAPAYAPGAILALYRALVEDTVDLTRSLGLPTAAVCPPGHEAEIAAWLPRGVAVVVQRGNGLADGLVSTFEQLCTPAGRRVVAFNADSPHLEPSVLESAFEALRNHDLVVGPADDGGYYLIGARQTYRALFDDESMSKRSAFEALIAKAEELGLRAAVMPEHYDVDLPADAVRLAGELSKDPRRAPRTAAVLAALHAGSERARR